MNTTITRRRKSERLTTEEKRLYKRYVQKFVSKIDAAEDLGISVVTLDAILTKGQGSPATIAAIRSKI